MVTLKSDNLTDLWAQRLTKLFGWNIRETNKPLEKKKIADDASDREDDNMYSFGPSESQDSDKEDSQPKVNRMMKSCNPNL